VNHYLLSVAVSTPRERWVGWLLWHIAHIGVWQNPRNTWTRFDSLMCRHQMPMQRHPHINCFDLK
jgi:hypothetical protein